MVFYKGAINYDTFQNMPYDKIFERRSNAIRISDEIERKMKK